MELPDWEFPDIHNMAKALLSSKEKIYLDAAKKANSYMKSAQDIKSLNKGINGGIKGAFPIYGWYAPFCYPNWAAKFFIDSLMLEDDKKVEDKLS